MEEIFVGIPILNRADLLARCLACITAAARVVVVNNNSYDTKFAAELRRLAEGWGAQVLHQERNLGVAASWNLLARSAFDCGHEWVFIGSNDAFLEPGSLEAAAAMAKESDVRVWHLHGWDCFLIHRDTIADVGWFDENFYPAYKEDEDYSYRCHLARLRRVHVPGAAAAHVGSATIASNPVYALRNLDTHFNWNLNHYRMKWGGDAGRERYVTPYDRKDVDHRWWPDPGRSIQVRDWDEGTNWRPAGRPPADKWDALQELRRFYERGRSEGAS